MASYPPAQCCTIGIKHSGEPQGKIVKVADKYDAYIASPPSGKAHDDVAILLIPDVLGIWINSQLIADQFAANGYTTLMIDEFNGDPLAPNRPADFNFGTWIAHGSDGNNPHTKESVDPIIVDAIQYLKNELGVKKIGAVGYCFGAKYVVRHYSSGIDVGYIAHPTLVEEDELAAITGPLSIAAAETDDLFPPDKRHKSEEILKARGHPYQINLYSGVSHGFSVRGDPKIKLQWFARRQAFLQAVSWFDEFLL